MEAFVQPALTSHQSNMGLIKGLIEALIRDGDEDYL